MPTRRNFLQMGFAACAGIILGSCAPAVTPDPVVLTLFTPTLPLFTKTPIPTSTSTPTEEPTKAQTITATPFPWAVIPDNIKLGLPKEGYSFGIEGENHVVLRPDGSVSYRFNMEFNKWEVVPMPLGHEVVQEFHEDYAYVMQPKDPHGLWMEVVDNFTVSKGESAYWAALGVAPTYEGALEYLESHNLRLPTVANSVKLKILQGKGGSHWGYVQMGTPSLFEQSEYIDLSDLLYVVVTKDYRNSNFAGTADFVDNTLKDNRDKLVECGSGDDDTFGLFGVKTDNGKGIRLVYVALSLSDKVDGPTGNKYEQLGNLMSGEMKNETRKLTARWKSYWKVFKEWEHGGKYLTSPMHITGKNAYSKNLAAYSWMDITPELDVFKLEGN